MMETEIGMMLPWQGNIGSLSKQGKARDRFSPWAYKRNATLSTP